MSIANNTRLLTALAIPAGFATWIILNKKSVRGDFFLLFIGLATSALSYVQQQNGDVHPTLHAVKVVVVYLLSLGASTVAYRISPWHPLAAFPGPFHWRISTLILARHSYTGHRHHVLEDLHKKYGKFVRIGPDSLSVSDANELLTIYGAKHHMSKPDSYRLPGRTPHVALFFQQKDDVHATRKSIWAQAFTPAALDNFMAPLHKNTWGLMACIERRSDKDGLVDLSDALCHWAYDIMGDATFGGSNGLALMKNGDPKKIIDGGKVATAQLDSFGLCPWLVEILWWTTGLGPMKQLMDLAASMVHARVKAEDIKIRDLMSYLIEGDPRTGNKVSVTDLEIDAIVAIQGGSDNTSTTLILAIYFLLSQPDLYARLRADVERAFHNDPAPDLLLHKETLQKIPFLDAVIREALRFGSPYYVPRLVPEGGVEMGGMYVPGGTNISSAAHAVQMSESNFSPDPRVYRPDRWLPGGLGPDSVTNKAALSSFTFGPHFCLGKNFAMHEMRMCLARLVLTYDMALPNGLDDGAFYKGLRNMRTTFFDAPLIVKAVRRSEVHIPVDL